MDSHADTTVLGSNCVVLAYTGKECEVSPYADEYDAIRNVPVVTGATVWAFSCWRDLKRGHSHPLLLPSP